MPINFQYYKVGAVEEGPITLSVIDDEICLFLDIEPDPEHFSEAYLTLQYNGPFIEKPVTEETLKAYIVKTYKEFKDDPAQHPYYAVFVKFMITDYNQESWRTVGK